MELVEQVARKLFQLQSEFTDSQVDTWWKLETPKARKAYMHRAKEIIPIVEEALTPAIQQAERERIFCNGSLEFHIADAEMLGEVGEWAECQAVGVFVYFPKELWDSLKE